jgi:hypothetical protein
MAEYNGKQAFTIPRHIRLKDGVNIQQISANKTLTYKDSMLQRLDAQVISLDVILPIEKNGGVFVINCQGQSITVKDGDGVTVKALSVGEGALFACDGTEWKQFI